MVQTFRASRSRISLKKIRTGWWPLQNSHIRVRILRTCGSYGQNVVSGMRRRKLARERAVMSDTDNASNY